MCKMNFDVLNFIIAVLALLVAIYSVYYTKRFNRRRVFIGNGTFISESQNATIAWFEVHNMSPVPVTLLSIEFFTAARKPMQPLYDYEPSQTYSSGANFSQIPDIIPGCLNSDMLDAPQVLHPYTSIELGYYFTKPDNCIYVKVNCAEKIHCFKRYQSFLVHFSNVQ